MKYTIGFSPCPNDAFIFYALIHQKIDTHGFQFNPVIEDVESLNRRALNNELDISKLSFATFSIVQHDYRLLDSGSALGTNCGPLLISKRTISKEEIPECSIAIPGIHTTANFLFTHFFPKCKSKKEVLFSRIEDLLFNEGVDAGVIIHENRFTYEKRGLKKIADLGELWEESTNLPIPLGGIVARKSMADEILTAIENLIRQSVQYAYANPDQVIAYVKTLSQEMEEEIMWQHIRLYVNDFTISLGEKGRSAVEKFLSTVGNASI